jgi:hypothetical protein
MRQARSNGGSSIIAVKEFVAPAETTSTTNHINNSNLFIGHLSF